LPDVSEGNWHIQSRLCQGIQRPDELLPLPASFRYVHSFVRKGFDLLFDQFDAIAQRLKALHHPFRVLERLPLIAVKVIIVVSEVPIYGWTSKGLHIGGAAKREVFLVVWAQVVENNRIDRRPPG
jgi:hypothetical protein